MEIQIH